MLKFKSFIGVSTVVLFTIILISAPRLASSAVIDRDEELKIITVHPTPSLELNVLGADDSGSDGAVMMVSLEYGGKLVNGEIAALRAANPGYQVNTVRADAESGTAILSLQDLKSEWSLPVRASQLGLYLNATVSLTPEQVRYLKKRGSQAAEAFSLKVPSSSSFLSTRVVEAYRADSNVCARVAGTNVRTVIRGLMELSKPREIRNLQTFDDLKKQILDRCFSLPNPSSSISSWSALLDTSVERTRDLPLITATFTQRTNTQLRHTVSPIIALSIH